MVLLNPALLVWASVAVISGGIRAVVQESVGDAMDLCLPRPRPAEGPHSAAGDVHTFLEEVVTTFRGQSVSNHHELLKRPPYHHKGDRGTWPYHFPEEALIVCHAGAATLGQIRTHKHVEELTPRARTNLFATLEERFLHGERRQTPAENGNLLFVVDMDGNIIIAPVYQGLGGAVYEVKHGDLTPGQTPMGRGASQKGAWGGDVVGDHAGGQFRGVARFGGEFNKVPGKNHEWVMHQKSGYALSRIQRNTILNFELHHPEMTDNDVWEELRGAQFAGSAPLGIDAVEKFRCYMTVALRVPTTVIDRSTCELGSAAEAPAKQGNLPVLSKCETLDGSSPCPALTAEGTTKLHLVGWVTSDNARCTMNPEAMSRELEAIDPSLRNVNSHPEPLATLRQKIKALKHSSCWLDNAFKAAVRDGCPLASASGERSMFTFFKFKIKSGKDDPALVMRELRALWCLGQRHADCHETIWDFWKQRCRPEH